MKKIFRMFVFSGIALYLTALWNKGFDIAYDPLSFIKALSLLALGYYLIAPIFKLLLLPLNIVTFGLASVVAYIALFYFIITKFSLAQIHDWNFPGLNIWFIHIPSIELNYWTNLVAVSFSISTVINLLESLL